MDSLLHEIVSGKYDNSLDGIIAACNLRKKDKSRDIAQAVVVGDVIQLISTLKPKYLAGQTVVVDKITGDGFTVHAQFPTGRRFDRNIVIKPTHIARVVARFLQ